MHFRALVLESSSSWLQLRSVVLQATAESKRCFKQLQSFSRNGYIFMLQEILSTNPLICFKHIIPQCPIVYKLRQASRVPDSTPHTAMRKLPTRADRARSGHFAVPQPHPCMTPHQRRLLLRHPCSSCVVNCGTLAIVGSCDLGYGGLLQILTAHCVVDCGTIGGLEPQFLSGKTIL